MSDEPNVPDVPAPPNGGMPIKGTRTPGSGRRKGMKGTPSRNRHAARLEADFPDYWPISVMAEGAQELAKEARKRQAESEGRDVSGWPPAIEASEKVVRHILPALKTVDFDAEALAGGLKVLVVDATRKPDEREPIDVTGEWTEDES